MRTVAEAVVHLIVTQDGDCFTVVRAVEPHRVPIYNSLPNQVII